SNSDELAASAEETSSAINEMAASIEEVTAMTESFASTVEQNAAAGEQLSRSVQSVAQSGQRISEVADAAAATAAQLDRTSHSVAALAREADEATRRASRDAGRGFAVVAEEIRNLADRSAKATSDIAGIIKALQSVAQEAVAASNDGLRVIDESNVQAEEGANGLRKILSSVTQATQIVGQI